MEAGQEFATQMEGLVQSSIEQINGLIQAFAEDPEGTAEQLNE